MAPSTGTPVRRKKSQRATGAVRATRRKQPAYRTGRETQEAILAAAETVLVKFGYAGFTLKRVAEVADIAVGNLSYHFPTKEILLELLIDQTLREYASRFVTLLPKNQTWDAEKLGQLVAWFMDDAVTVRYTHLFRQLWAAALHSPALNAALTHFYEGSIEAVVEALAPSFDARHRAELRTLICFMCVLSEGSSVLFGARPRPATAFSELKLLSQGAVVQLVKSSFSK